MSDVVLFLRKQGSPRIPRYIADRANPMDLTDRDFIKKYRLSKESYLFVCDQLHEDLYRHTNGYSVEMQVLSVLSLLGTGSFQTVLQDDQFLRMSQSTISRNLSKVCGALIRKLPDFVSFPNTPEQLAEVREGFYAKFGFPSVAGVIDCTHVYIEKPYTPDWFVYLNRKGKFSLNVQIICDVNLKILDIVARWPGSCHDSFIWGLCGAKAEMEESHSSTNPSFLIGDSGYPLEPWLLKLYANPRSPIESHFNMRITSLRSTIERCNGVLKSRFRCIHETGGCLIYSPDKICEMVLAIAVLHNVCINFNVPLPEDEEDLGLEEEPAQHRRIRNNQHLAIGNAIRTRIAHFLFNQR